jgi:hypothetical protein
MCIVELEVGCLTNFEYIMASDKEKVKLYKLIVHHKNFSGLYQEIHIIHIFS